MKSTLPLILILAAAPVFAEDTREAEAHEHGVGTLNIAIEGKTVAMEFHAPGADIVGFEYAATSAKDRDAIASAVALLARPADLFVLPADARCTVTQASASLEKEDDHDDEAKHDDDHDDHAEEANHTEFHAEYLLNCENPSAIDNITFAYFDTFLNAREVEVQIVSTTGAKAFEVERETPKLDLRSLF